MDEGSWEGKLGLDYSPKPHHGLVFRPSLVFHFLT